MSKRLRAAGVALLTATLLAGCSTIAPISDVGAGASGFHLAQVAGAPPTRDRLIRVDRVATPPSNRYEWTVASVDPTSRELRIAYTDGACTTADRLAVEETATRVVIGITASATYSGNCAAIGIPRSTTITLRKPLGGRALMEGATGVNDGLRTVQDPARLPDPICSADGGTGRDVPVGMPDAGARMAPTAATTAFVCRTWWPKGRVRVTSRTIADRAEVVALAAAIDAGSTALRPGAPDRTCPSKDDRASWYDVTFEGPGIRVEVRTDAISCDTITNGASSGTMTPELVRDLDARFAS